MRFRDNEGPFCTGPVGTWERGNCDEIPVKCALHSQCVVCEKPAIYCDLHSPTGKCVSENCTNPVTILMCSKHFTELIQPQCTHPSHKDSVEARYQLCQPHFLDTVLGVARSYTASIGGAVKYPQPSGILINGPSVIYDRDAYGAEYLQQTKPVEVKPLDIMCEIGGHTQSTRHHCDTCFDIAVKQQVVKVLEGLGIVLR